MEWPGRPLEEGWGSCFLIKMLWETGSGAPGFQEEVSLDPKGKEKGRKVERKLESSSVKVMRAWPTPRQGAPWLAPRNPLTQEDRQ